MPSSESGHLESEVTTTPQVEPKNGYALAKVAARAADAKLGENTLILDVRDLLSVVDAFVITEGRNQRQVDTLVDEIETATKATYGRGPITIEGRNDGTWVLMDYGDVLVHVFLDETRSFYDLEHLWSSAPRVAWEI
ncbi:MAG: ribosome silencing factor [Actinomycetes bacterium]